MDDLDYLPGQLDLEAVIEQRRLLAMSTGNRVHPVTDRGHDLYETPAVATRSLLQVERIPDVVWEPCCGPGAIVRELRAAGRTVIATDLIDYGCPDSTSRRDFLMEREAPASCIVTNPPFKLAEEFVAHALELAPEVYMLLRVAFLEGLRWQDRGFDRHLARVHIFAPRLPMMHRAGWDGPINNSSAMPFGWFVFHRDARRIGGVGPQVMWFNWRKELVEDESLTIDAESSVQSELLGVT
jgi:hypothetical protein